MKSSAELVRTAWKLGVVVPSFNIPYLPMMEPVVRAARDQDAVAFIAVARLEWIKFESRSLAAVMEEYQRCKDTRHVRLHLDHVPVMDEDHQQVDVPAIIKEAIALGYQSVMVDGSRLALADNIRATRAVVELAHAAGIACEAELGAVLGHEEGPLPPYEDLFKSGKGFTRVEEARRFVRESGCDWLSVAIGNIHGAVSQAARSNKKVEAHLNLDHLDLLREATGIPLVLHGGSGVCRADVRAGMKRGLAKVNVGTEIRQAYEVALKASGDVAAAQQAVYAKTAWLIDEYFGIKGLRAAIAGQD